ncbi:MAG: carboxypeptidase-like regulatory domain-containing protein [Bacteroidales bacterium]|nr:carboxypeptidase-like regulatory domain-containing protein [Bacteroidales bacterium]
MKKVKILSLLFVAFAAVAFFNSCNKEYALPTVAWEGPVSVIVDFESEDNYDVNLAITFGAEAGLNEIHIFKYSYSGLDDMTTVEMAAPTGYTDLTTFDYTFTDDNDAADFTGGVTKIVYEFVVTDAELQETTKEYTIFVVEAYSVTFVVKDEADNAIADAIVTFNGVANTAGDYVVNYVEVGTYEYSVAKAGYQTVTVTDFVMPENDTTVDVVLVQNIDAEWSAEIPLALYGQTAWASYDGNPVTNYMSNVIGVAFNFTDATTVKIEDTDYAGGSLGCEGWVIVTDLENLTTQASLATAWEAGTEIHEYELPYDQHKAYAPVYFISKMGSTYKLVYYVAGHRDSSTGNVVVFKYKD